MATAASQSYSQLTKKIAALMISDQPNKHRLVSLATVLIVWATWGLTACGSGSGYQDFIEGFTWPERSREGRGSFQTHTPQGMDL